MILYGLCAQPFNLTACPLRSVVDPKWFLSDPDHELRMIRTATTTGSVARAGSRWCGLPRSLCWSENVPPSQAQESPLPCSEPVLFMQNILWKIVNEEKGSTYFVPTFVAVLHILSILARIRIHVSGSVFVLGRIQSQRIRILLSLKVLN